MNTSKPKTTTRVEPHPTQTVGQEIAYIGAGVGMLVIALTFHLLATRLPASAQPGMIILRPDEKPARHTTPSGDEPRRLPIQRGNEPLLIIDSQRGTDRPLSVTL